jgi:AcrR family transcriptional regulator
VPQQRDENARQRILTAVQELVAERGPAQATVTEIARRAGVGRQTIYRWWRNRSLLVIEALVEMAETQFQFSDTGKFEADVKRQMRRMARSFSGPSGSSRQGAHRGQSRGSGDRCGVQGSVLPSAPGGGRAMVRRGIELGALRPDVDVDGVVYSLYGPLWMALLVGHVPVSQALADSALATTLDAQRNSGVF